MKFDMQIEIKSVLVRTVSYFNTVDSDWFIY